MPTVTPEGSRSRTFHQRRAGKDACVAGWAKLFFDRLGFPPCVRACKRITLDTQGDWNMGEQHLEPNRKHHPV